MADRHGPMRTGQFRVEIDEVEVAGWQSVTLPSSSTEEAGGPDSGETIWGQTTLADLVMERAVQSDDTVLFDWREAVRMGNVDDGRKEIAVVLVDEEGEPRIRWEFQDAWIKVYDPPRLDASADDEVATESITVAFDEMIREEA